MPTRLGWGLVLLLGGIAFAALNTGNNLLYLLLGLCAAALVVAFVAGGRALARLSLELSYPEEILAGEPTAMVVVLGNAHGRLPSPAVEIRDARGARQASSAASPPLEPGESRTRFLPAHFPRRGLFPAARLQLATDDPLGLVRRRRTVDPGGEYYVFPAPLPLATREEALAHQRGEAPARRIGEGLELHQMRDYQWSDDSRHIDWRATARAGKLMVKEFLDSDAERLVILFDPGVKRLDAWVGPRFEEQVSLAAALVLRCAEERTPFRFLAPDCTFREVDPPGGHRAVLEYLATARPLVSDEPEAFGADLVGRPGVIRLSLRDGAAP